MHRRTLLATALAATVARPSFAAAKPVVLELFTSQGCSSCPPADALLGRLAQRQSVVALAWHVDYWDHLGWHDPFASREATTRQQTYARSLANIVFTPALVVNGARIVVGSDRAAVEAAIEAAAALPVPVALSRREAGIAVELGAAPGPVRALSVSYDPQHATAVAAGENQGEQLREYRIVRRVETLAEWDGAARNLTMPPASQGQGQAVLLQSAGDLRILGAADLPPA